MRKSQKKKFSGNCFLGPGDIPLFGKTIKNKNASIGRVAHRTGYGNNAQSVYHYFLDTLHVCFFIVSVCKFQKKKYFTRGGMHPSI